MLIAPRDASFRTTSALPFSPQASGVVTLAQSRLGGGGEMSEIPASLGESVNYHKHTAAQMSKGPMSYLNKAPFCELLPF